MTDIERAVKEADEYMAEHRVTEAWRVIRRLRDTLVRSASKGVIVGRDEA